MLIFAERRARARVCAYVTFKISESSALGMRYILIIRLRANFILMSQFVCRKYGKPIEVQFTVPVFVARRVFPIRRG